jgi:putative heme-binding domain-containing protein
MNRICAGGGIVVLFCGLVAWSGEPPVPAGKPGGQAREEVKVLVSRLTFASPLSDQLAVVELLRQMPNEQVSEALLQNWEHHGPRVHQAVVCALLWREPWLGILQPRSASRPEFDASRDWALRDIWLRHPSAAVRAGADGLRRPPPPPSPAVRDSLAQLRPALEIPGNPERGGGLFTEATCANCHQVEDVGRHIGPDLNRLVDRSPRTLLIHTVDPNRVVEHRYIEYTVVTASGLLISGLLLDESEFQLTLADGQGNLRDVRREDIDEWVSHGRSQMPEGLGANLTPQQLADLIAFIGTRR